MRAAALVVDALQQRRGVRPVDTERALLLVGEVVRRLEVVAAHVAAAKRPQSRLLERDEAAIVAEELVAAGPRQADLHVLGHEAVHVPGGKPAAVGLVERPDHLQEIVEQLVRVDDRLVVVGPPALGERARERQLVVLACEAERVRAHVGAALREQRGHGRRVEPARERDGDGDVGERPANDRVAQTFAQLPGIAAAPELELPPALDARHPALEVVAEQVPGGSRFTPARIERSPGTKRRLR